MEISRNKQGDVIYEFIQLLLDIHRLTDFAICKEDDKILSFISQNLKDNSEIQNIDNISFDVYLNYTKVRFNGILELIEDYEDTLIDFRKTSAILNRARRIINSTQIHITDLKRLLIEMNREFRRLKDNIDGLETTSYRKYLKLFVLIMSIVMSSVGALLFDNIENPLWIVFILGIASYVSYFPINAIFKYFYMNHLIVGKNRVFEKNQYFEDINEH